MAGFPHKHLKIPANRTKLRFRGRGGGGFYRRKLTREQHAARLSRQLGEVEDQFQEEHKKREGNEVPDDFGLLLNIQSAPGFPLKID